MVQPNWWLLFVVALIPIFIGRLWYNHLFKSTWLSHADVSEDRANSVKLIKTLGIGYLFGFLAAYMLSLNAVHQVSVFQLFFGDPALQDTSSDIYKTVTEFMDKYGDRHRSLGHGVIHGVEMALLLGLPFIGIHSIYENRSFQYIFLHIGYWVVCFAIMGAILSAYF